MKVILTTLNAKFIHSNLALRWLYVARSPDADVKIQEFTIRDDLDRCADVLAKECPDIIGISIYIWNSKETKEWIVKIKERLPNVRIILGGPEVSFESEKWLELPIECILRGEGEKTFWQVCNNETGVDGYLSKNEVSSVEFAKVDLRWLETLEMPYFLDFDAQQSAHRYRYVETSRGCPYQCSYCLSSRDNQVRLFSEEYVLSFLDKMELSRCKQVKFLDRTFNVYPERAYRIAQKIQSMTIDTTFQVELVVDTLSKELLEFFKKHPQRFRFEVGVQSFNQKTLQSVSRYQDLDRLVKNIKELNLSGNHLHVDLIAGLPFENRESFKKSFHQLFACFSDEIQVGLLKLLPGTRLREESEELNIIYDLESPYTVIETPWMSKSDINEIVALYQATEKLYNSGRLQRSLNILYKMDVDVFELLIRCGKEIINFDGQIQIKDMFLMVERNIDYTGCSLKQEEIRALLSTDYYSLFKQKPTRLFENRVEVELRKEVYKALIDQNIFSEQELNQYAKLEWGYNEGEKQLLLIVYSKNQSYPQVFWIKSKGEKQYGIMDSNTK